MVCKPVKEMAEDIKNIEGEVAIVFTLSETINAPEIHCITWKKDAKFKYLECDYISEQFLPMSKFRVNVLDMHGNSIQKVFLLNY